MSRLKCALTLALLIGGTAPGRADTTPDAGLLLSRLVIEARYEEARALLRAQVKGRADAALHVAQLEGLIRVREGKPDEAIAIFRAIVAAAPDFLPARFELARLLGVRGDREGAYHHLETIAEGSDHPALRQIAENAMQRTAADRPWGFSLHGSIVPSSNVNRGAGGDTFETGGMVFSIDEDSRRQSGIGANFGATGWYTHLLGSWTTLTASATIDATKFAKGTAHDSARVEGSLTLARRFGRVTLSAGPVVKHHWSAWSRYLLQYGVNLGADLPVGNRDMVSLGFQALAQDYATLDYRDGYRFTGTLSWKHVFSPSFHVIAGLGATVERTGRSHLDHDDFVASFRANREWPGGLIGSFFGSYERHGYLGNFPGTASPRLDDKLSVGLTLAHRRFTIAGFMPQLTYQYARQFSNVSFFDHDSHDLSLGLTRRY